MVTNRTHFSWSQYYLWKKSKREFYKRYILGEESKSNKYFAKGKELSRYLEKGEILHYSNDPLLETVGKLVPKLDIMEEEIIVDLQGTKLLAFLDTISIDSTEFNEYKTGKIPWTQLLVDEHEQLDFYALCIFIRSGETIIPKCKLIWIETEEVEEDDEGNSGKITLLKYTGVVEEFIRKFTKKDIVRILTKILVILKEIDEYEYTELDLEDEFVNRYIELLAKKKEINSELSIMKLEVSTRLEAVELNYATTDKGRFSISKRSAWHYSNKLNDFVSKHKQLVKEWQSKEKKNGIAIVTYTESILFKEIK